jgi:hypothetical protein
MKDETLFVAEMLTAANGNGRRHDEECELDDRANADGSATGDGTRTLPLIKSQMMTIAPLAAHGQRSQKMAERATSFTRRSR